jgi:hypothetical protein
MVDSGWGKGPLTRKRHSRHHERIDAFVQGKTPRLGCDACRMRRPITPMDDEPSRPALNNAVASTVPAE